MSNEAGYAALDDLMSRLNRLGIFAREVAKEAAPMVETAAKQRAAQGIGPDGKPWKPRKDGTRALQGVENSISAQALGEIVQIVLTGGAIFSNNSQGADRRRVLPETGADLPDWLVAVIEKAAGNVWRRTMGGSQ